MISAVTVDQGPPLHFDGTAPIAPKLVRRLPRRVSIDGAEAANVVEVLNALSCATRLSPAAR